MKKILVAVVVAFFILYFTDFGVAIVQLFKNEHGKTNWQYVANWSSGILIILLSSTAIVLFFSRLAKEKANLELEAIKNDLEIRVQERTATLAESNQKLKDEVEKHLTTSKQLHDSEYYLNSILASMPTMLVGLNPKGEVTQWNQKAEKYTGVLAKNAIGKNLWEAYPIITVTPTQVREALTKTEATTIRQNQRGLFHFDITIYPLHGNGESGVVLLLDDVSKQVKSENKLIQKDKISSMGELASSMAHDMSMPLQGLMTDIKQIDAKISLFKQNEQSFTAENLSEIAASLTDAIAQGKQASAIIDNLLDFSGSQRHDKQVADMTEVMDHSIELAQNVLSLPQGMHFTDVKIERVYDKKLPKVSCYVSEIQQVYLSLLRHCFYSIGKTKRANFDPTIRVRVMECYGALWIKISHNGLGLTGEEQQSIFEPFFSNLPLDSEYDADKRLSFSHFVITEHHQGQMAVTSDVEVGTTFHIQFD